MNKFLIILNTINGFIFIVLGLVNSNIVGSDQRNIWSLYVHRIKARIRIKKTERDIFLIIIRYL